MGGEKIRPHTYTADYDEIHITYSEIL